MTKGVVWYGGHGRGTHLDIPSRCMEGQKRELQGQWALIARRGVKSGDIVENSCVEPVHKTKIRILAKI